MFNNKRIEELEKKVETLTNLVEKLNINYNDLWEETHPQTMGGK